MKKAISLILCAVLLIVSVSSTGIFAVSAEETNLWANISVEDFGTKDQTPTSPNFGFEQYTNTYGKAFNVKLAYYTSFYIEMPEMETNSAYNLSFKYDNKIIANNAGSIRSISVVTEEEMAQITDTDGIVLPSTATSLGSSLSLDKGGYTDFAASFETGNAETKHYLYFVTNYAYWLYLCDFKLTKAASYNVNVIGGAANKTSTPAGKTVTITATPTSAQAFNYWEVTSGNVTLSDIFSPTATFTMPAEDVSVKAVYIQNIWSNISAGDWFTRQVETAVTDPLTLEEKKMTDVYPENFTYTADGSFSLKPAAGKHYYVKLPKIETNKEYKIAVDYSVTNLNESSTPTLYKVFLVPESAFTNKYTWSTTGEMYSDRAWLGSHDIYLKKALSADELNGTISYEFNSKTKQQYYLFLMFTNIGSVTYSNFSLNEIPLNGVSVNGGTADITSAKRGTEVTITANTPASGTVFDKWEVISGGVTLADPYSATTTFTMGNNSVSLKAIYREYGAKIVYVNTDGTPYQDSENLNVSTSNIAENTDGTNTITINYDKMDGINSFLGWYDGEKLLSNEEIYTYNPDEVNISTVTAKILCRNVLTGAASFEGYENDTNMRVEPIATGVAPYDDKWGLMVSSTYERENMGFYLKTVGETNTTYYTDVGYDRETGTYYAEADRKTAKYMATPYSGNSMLALSSAYRSFTRRLEGLKPNTSYTISMYVMNPDEYNFLSSVVVSDSYTIKPSYLSVMSNRFVTNSQKIASANIYGFYEEPRTEELFETNVTVTDKSSVRNWKKISFSFVTGDNADNLYLSLYPRNRSSWYTRCQTYIDNMVCYENAIDYAGNAMRATSATLPQALRYKFSVKNEMLTSYAGYNFKELGILAVDNSSLAGSQLYKGNEFAKDIKVTEKNYQYKDGDTENTYFTAALYNIGSTFGRIDYSKYATEYTVRPYFVYTDKSGKEIIIYGDPVSVSIFDVMYAIRDWPQNPDDLSVVNDILKDTTIKNEYTAWQPANGWNIVNDNPPTNYDYSFAIIGDVQYTTENYPEDLPYIYDWLINNKDDKNLEYVIGLGDITNMSTDKEYVNIDAQLLRLKEAGIDQSVIRGNHDEIAGYDKYITAEKYSYGGEKFASYDGTMKTYYRIITIGGVKYMMLTLDFFPSTVEVAWAREAIDANPDCNVIISTHGYLDGNMTLLQEKEVYDVDDRLDANGNPLGGHAGQYIYDNLVLPCSNVVMVLCGHECSYGPETKLLTRADGTTAVQILIDFQQPEYTDLRSYGMIAMFYFSNGGQTITVEWFSSVKDEYYMDKYQFSFDVNVIK